MAIYRPPQAQDGDHREQSGDRMVDPSSSLGSGGAVAERAKGEGLHDRLEHWLLHLNDNPRVREFNKIRNLCGDFVNHPRVQMFILLLIVINAIMMGIATTDYVTDEPAIEAAFETVDIVFLAIFSFELAMQFLYKGFNIFRDGWLVFDFLIIVPSWATMKSETGNNLQVIRAFRIFRALRIITRVQTMRNLVTAVLDIMPRLGAITLLLIIIFYIFAVLFTNLFGELDLGEEYFTTLHQTLFTLFVFMTMEWAEVAREVMENEGFWWAWAPFIAFVMVSGFLVFNLIIAVVCDAVAVIENKSNLGPDVFGVGGLSGSGEEGMNGAFDAKQEEREILDNLEERVASVLKTQKDMLATLEALAQGRFVALPATAPPRGEVREGGGDTFKNE